MDIWLSGLDPATTARHPRPCNPKALNSMAKPSKVAASFDASRKQAVIYARVSSKEQEKEGFSIPAQLKLLKEYAAAQGFTVAARICGRGDG